MFFPEEERKAEPRQKAEEFFLREKPLCPEPFRFCLRLSLSG